MSTPFYFIQNGGIIMPGKPIKRLHAQKPPEKITSLKEIDKIVTEIKDKFERLEPRQHIKVLE